MENGKYRNNEDGVLISSKFSGMFFKRNALKNRNILYKHHFKFLFAVAITFLLLGVFFKLFLQVTFTITMQLGFISVFTKIVRDIGLICPVLQNNNAFAEVLQQKPHEYAYNWNEFHAANLIHFKQNHKEKMPEQ
ncbi:hypothetical protein DVR12_05040 [Chitinophaga silvatica]|uniref:Uncharacterized protein n=1 Tax=Chitinophaga silvatica TaxID=2282649 RepID=A0A3E1YDL6_9BACT|nr:hypothetical protein DVR12_05040 [Chitinophaga silvatica]